MLALTLHNMWSHRRRLVGTFLAIFLGVAFLSGTLVLGDTLKANFDVLFADADGGTDAVVRNAALVDDGPAGQRGPIDAAVLDRVRHVDGVAAAEPVIEGFGQLLDRDGKGVGGDGRPKIAGNWPGDPKMSAYHLVEGRAPRADDEVVVNRAAVDAGGFHLGDRIAIQVPERLEVTLVGISRWRDSDAFGQTTFTAFSLLGAQEHILKRTDQITSVSVAAAPGVAQTELVNRLRPVLPGGVEAITGDATAREDADTVEKGFVSIFSTFLTVFAVVALLVGTFSIYNTLSIIVAQRTKESALLRALGATRRAVLVSVVVEALLLGLVASLAGFAGGIGLAVLLKALFSAVGFALPSSGLTLTARTAAISLPVGVGVALLAGLVPAARASRVPPIAALREVAVGRAGAMRRRAVVGGVSAVAGVVLAVADVSAALVGVGAALTVVGVIVLGPVVARPASRLLGAPLARLRGVTGALARQNAMRNPRRTAGAAVALMIGVGVVTVFTVFAASLKATVDDGVTSTFASDLMIAASPRGGDAVDPKVAGAVAALPDVAAATAIGTGNALVDGTSRQLGIVDPPALTGVLRLDTTAGRIDQLHTGQLAVSDEAAEKNRWQVGTRFPIRYADGATEEAVVGAVFKANFALGFDYLLPRPMWTPHVAQSLDSMVFVSLRDGVDPAAAKKSVGAVARQLGAPAPQTLPEFAASRTKNVDQILGIVYLMLALAVLIALMGIANALSLAIHERTRELGLLRAVGTTRAQLRSMVRGEAVITSVFGTVGGLVLGAFLGAMVVRGALTGGSFAAPPVRLLVVLVVGAAAGLLAGMRPARRAARLNVLSAIATE